MGKKKGKKGSGAEKTAAKTQKNAAKKSKKELRETGERDIEELIAEFKEKDRKKVEIREEKCGPPSARSNMTLVAHPDREELVLFGGEYFNGNKTFLYNDMFLYNLKNGDWTQVISPNSPPPRCSHQAVALKQGGGQMWVFGGEFASPSQAQFYHYKDLWVFHFRSRQWEKVSASGGPSARSGHRMIALKKMLIVFGGFHDNTRDFKYYNDVHIFNLETYQWAKIDVKGQGPCPRSGCQLMVNPEQTGVLVYGGYSKERVKKDVDVGRTHSDMFLLSMDVKKIKDQGEVVWKWSGVKQSGTRPSPRCGMTSVVSSSTSAFFFGGVYDEEEDDENVNGVFYDEMYTLDLEKVRWHTVRLKGKKDTDEQKKKRRRRKKEAGDDAMECEDEGDEESDTEQSASIPSDDTPPSTAPQPMDVETSAAGDAAAMVTDSSGVTTYDDGIFTVTVGGADSQDGGGDGMSVKDGPSGHGRGAQWPSPRMNCLLTVKHGCIYLYGGLCEEGDKQLTYNDMYVLDLHKLDTWKTLVEGDLKAQVWEGSDSSDDDDDEDDDDSEDDDDEMAAEGATGGR